MKQTDIKQQLENTLVTFKALLQLLNGPNLVIGGMNALYLHGLILGRMPTDLDIIIYNPTKLQLEVLKNIDDFQVKRRNFNLGYGDTQRSYKFKVDNFILDIILDEDKLPSMFLTYNGYNVQTVDNVIKAKSKYSFSSETHIYSREKDLIDMMELKNLNFNKK